MAAQRAREEMKEQRIVLKDSVDPTRGIPDPESIKARQSQIPGPFGFLGRGAGAGAGELEMMRFQQQMLENILHRHRPHPPPDHYMQDMVARMGEIFRLRKEGRAQQRLARRAEMEALRDLRIHNWISREPQQPVQPPQPLVVPAHAQF